MGHDGGDPANQGDSAGSDPVGADTNSGDANVGDSAVGDPTPPGDPYVPPTCLDRGVPREIRSPAMGSLVFSEIFADPAGADDYKDWFELFVMADTDLNDVEFASVVTGAPVRKSLASADCIAVAAGSYVVLGGENAATASLSVRHVLTGLQLPNSSTAAASATLSLSKGGVAIDSMTYPLPATSGVAYMLKAGLPDAVGNDDAAAWCNAGVPFVDPTITGSPGSANDVCSPACKEADVWRAQVAPQVGDLVLTELYPNPTGNDADREWVEVFVTRAVDLRGLMLEVQTSSTNTQTLSGDLCLPAALGSYVVLADTGVGADGVAPTHTLSGLSMANSSTSVAVAAVRLMRAGAIIDAANYPLPASEGASYALTGTITDATQNDVPTNWCLSTLATGPFTGFGSPGAANTTCP